MYLDESVQYFDSSHYQKLYKEPRIFLVTGTLVVTETGREAVL